MKSYTQHLPTLVQWYEENKRDLPWRQTKDPYRIWISETMLQQTTSRAVIPYYNNFITQFPNLKSLAQAPLEQVYRAWAGLGYYSRARNLHRAAQLLATNSEFPQSHVELLKLPGFGPYTSRAVASLAFAEPVGVLDGNVIRVLSRWLNQPVAWWTQAGRKLLQQEIDQWAQQDFSPAIVNQAVMELGATLCSPRSPSCWSCPLRSSCRAYQGDQVHLLPLAKPKRPKEIWHWQVQIFEHRNNIAILKNHYAPFLRQQWIFPGKVKKLATPPKTYHFRHSITHHDIFVTLRPPQPTIEKWVENEAQWIPKEDLASWNPASLLRKALQTNSGGHGE